MKKKNETTETIVINGDSLTMTATSGLLQDCEHPKHIKIGYKEYEIVKKEEVIDLPNECYGKIDYDKETIEIATKFNQKQQNATFLHEMVHGIFEKLDLTELRGNEQIVNQVAQTLYEIILDNPHIFTMQDI